MTTTITSPTLGATQTVRPHLRMLGITAAVFGVVSLFMPSLGSLVFGLGALLSGLFNLVAFGTHRQYRGWATFGVITGTLTVIFSLLIFSGIITEPFTIGGKL